MKDNKAIFVSALMSHPEIPEPVKALAESVTELVESTLDETYFVFLDEQIKLCPRGPEWNEILESRKKSLSAFCDKQLIRGRIEHDGKDYFIRVDPQNESVVHWEGYEKLAKKGTARY